MPRDFNSFINENKVNIDPTDEKVQGYKDIKSCTISVASNKKKKRKILSLATDYALNTLGMETVYLRINPDDNNVIKYLEDNKFECLGDEKGSIIYLKEKTD